MTGTRPAEILRHLEQSGTPDADLLARFAAAKDAAAFAELVRRHGALVLGVCRRVTGQEQDAEDAFQATFLVLAKKAGSLRNTALLGNWLYGVAYRVAWRAKRAASRRRAREIAVAVLPDPPAPALEFGAAELQPILDEELAALPARYRDAIVLCDLRGASREEAAAALGIPEGTLSSRLANGRKRLAARLTKRGVALSVAALPLSVIEAQAVVTVPNELLTKTCGLVAAWAKSGTVPASLAQLAEGGLAVRKILVLGAAMLVSVAGAVLAARPEAPPADPPKPPVVAQKAAEQPPKTAPDAKPTDKPAVAYTSSPRLKAGWDLQIGNTNKLIWSPDGATVGVVGWVSSDQKGRKWAFYLLRYPSKSEPQDRSLTVLPRNGHFVGFSPDGKYAITDLRESGLVSGYHRLTWWDPSKASMGFGKHVAELAGNAEVRTVEFEGAYWRSYAFTADGKSFRTIRSELGSKGGYTAKEVIEVDSTTGKTGKVLLKLELGLASPSFFPVFSPDGKRLATIDKELSKVTVYDLDRGTKLCEHTFSGDKDVLRYITVQSLDRSYQMVFSQNGRRLVVARGLGRVSVLDAETATELPPLEGIEGAFTYPTIQAFTSDGRLLALAGESCDARTKLPNSMANPERASFFLKVWDTQTGKVVKSWDRSPTVAFCPTRPVLAMLEPNGEDTTRIGFWDFSAEAEKK